MPDCPHGSPVASECIRCVIEERDRLWKSHRLCEDQLIWLAGWCKRVLGIENNNVLGRDGWPKTLAEVVAKAAEDCIAGLRTDVKRLKALCDRLVAENAELRTAKGDE